jgi:hypothetical protein
MFPSLKVGQRNLSRDAQIILVVIISSGPIVPPAPIMKPIPNLNEFLTAFILRGGPNGKESSHLHSNGTNDVHVSSEHHPVFGGGRAIRPHHHYHFTYS